MLKFYGLNTSVQFTNNIVDNINRKKFKYMPKKIIIRYMGPPDSIHRETIYAEYIFDTDTIRLNESALKNDDEFLVTLLHEMDHARMSRNHGNNKFKQMYITETTNKEMSGNDGYYSNKYELQAEEWAHSELSRWQNKL